MYTVDNILTVANSMDTCEETKLSFLIAASEQLKRIREAEDVLETIYIIATCEIASSFPIPFVTELTQTVLEQLLIIDDAEGVLMDIMDTFA